MPDSKPVKRHPPIKSVIVLVAICAIISGILSVVNIITAPIIEARRVEAIRQTLIVLLPDATGFIEIEIDMDNVEAVYKDDGGSGYAIITVATGYKAPIAVITAFGNDGKIIAVSVDASGETPGIGTQAALESYTDKFKSLEGSVAGVDTIAGATYSADAVKQAVDTAIAAFEKIREG